jgi:hypothetical protein
VATKTVVRTVLFADMKGSTELIGETGPKSASRRPPSCSST